MGLLSTVVILPAAPLPLLLVVLRLFIFVLLVLGRFTLFHFTVVTFLNLPFTAFLSCLSFGVVLHHISSYSILLSVLSFYQHLNVVNNLIV